MRNRQVNRVTALQYIRKLRGGSQPILVQASDGFLYVVKFNNNLQGDNLAFNESMGSELFNMCGLPGPSWAAVWISEEFISRNRGCWMETSEGLRRPRAGWCFGSQFLGLSDAPLLEILPGSSFRRIRERENFWKAWILDIFSNHADHRQTLFLRDEAGWLDAYFIDHGHLFGGPQGTADPSFLASRYLDLRIYPEVSITDCNRIQQALEFIDRVELTHTAESLPEEWITPSAALRFKDFLERICDAALLRNIRYFILDSANGKGEDFEQRYARPIARCGNAMLCAQIPPSRAVLQIGGWKGHSISRQMPQGTESLCG